MHHHFTQHDVHFILRSQPGISDWQLPATAISRPLSGGTRICRYIVSSRSFSRGRLNGARTAHYEDILNGVARQSSETERRADEAERICEKIKKAQYMEGHVGERYSGVISGVTSWGLYAELENTVEGLIPVGSMTEDYFVYDEANCRLVGDRTGIFYQLGERA